MWHRLLRHGCGGNLKSNLQRMITTMTTERNYFGNDEQWCKHCGTGRIRAGTLRKLNRLREIRNKATSLSSAYRCPDYNDSVSSTGRHGPHTTGGAVDIPCSGQEAREMLFAGVLVSAVEAGLLTVEQAQEWLPQMLANGFTGIGVNQRGDHGKRFVHFDDLPAGGTGPRPWVWSY